MILSDILWNISYRFGGNSCNMDSDITRVTSNWQDSARGTLFACTETVLRDAHINAPAAYSKGCRHFLCRRMPELPPDATVLLVEDVGEVLGDVAANLYANPARELSVIGVVGDAGKTSVIEMARALLEQDGKAVAAITSDGYFLSEQHRMAGPVAPDAAVIQAFLAECRAAGVQTVLLELSAYQLHQKCHKSIPFAAVLLTNLKESVPPNGVFSTWEEYRAAICSLLEENAAFTLLPAELAELAPDDADRVITLGAGGDLRVDRIAPAAFQSGFGSKLELVLDGGTKVPVFLPVPGDFFAENALEAAAIARFCGLSPHTIAVGLGTYLPRGRMECVYAADERYVFVDSAYTADALQRALEALRPFATGRLSVLVGSVGGRAFERRVPLGRAASLYADYVYLTADDPDLEDPRKICNEILQGVVDPARACIIPDRERAITRAVREMRPGDILLIAGKGALRTHRLAGQAMPFDEKEIVFRAAALL